jgi:hypothetical protein
MFRGLLLLAGFALMGCALDPSTQKVRAWQATKIEAAQLTDVQLSEAQIAKLKERSGNAQFTWHRAKRYSDGKIFVCHLTTTKGLLRSDIRVHSGFFESDGSYQESGAHLMGTRILLQECRSRGFDPPVTITTTVTPMRI